MRRLFVLLAAGLVAGCVDVVNAGNVVVSPQLLDAGNETPPPPDAEQALDELCVRTGGHVEVRDCCGGQDFAQLCWQGQCCGMASSQPMIKLRLCICPVNQCWNPTARPPKVPAGCS